MAGIGFQLKKLFNKGIVGKVQASIFSVIISSGPWLITILSIATVSTFARHALSKHDTMVLQSMVSYSFAFSLIIFGLIEMPVTRYLADKHYQNDSTTFSSVYVALLTFTVFLCSTIGTIFYSWFSFDLIRVTLGLSFLVSVYVIWVAMMFLSAAKRYLQIVYGYLVGAIVAILGGYFLSPHFGFVGYQWAFTMGEVVIAIWLSAVIFLEFGPPQGLHFEFLEYFVRYRMLIVIGTCYYLGIWIDKFVFWFAAEAENVEGLFYTNNYYDTAIFVAYISIVPCLTIFLVKTETQFFSTYTHFFGLIERKASYPMIVSASDDIIADLKRSVAVIVKWQSVISGACFYFADEIITVLRLPSLMLSIFKYGIIGAYLQAFFLTLVIVLMYFDARKDALIVYGSFLSVNGILALATAIPGENN